MKKILVFIFGAVLITGCGQRHSAKGIVKDFIREYAVTDDYALIFGKLDSTYRINDSIMGDLQKRCADDKFFKQPVSLGDYHGIKTKLLLQTKIIMKDDTLRRTFYLHPDLKTKGILAVKEN